MATSERDQLKQLDNLLSMGNQAWLVGAGISVSAGLPLMGALTDRVLALAKGHAHEKCLQEAKSSLPAGSTIEQILSLFADYLAIAERCQAKQAMIGKHKVDCTQLRELVDQVLRWISDTIRWGYVPASGGTPEKAGTRDAPIVTIDGHQAFMRAIFSRGQAGLAERRSAVRFFTTNYDTLLEDALSLCCVPYWDGCTGGAVAFRSYQYGQGEPANGFRAHIIKLHGSIDWYMDDRNQIFRVRDNDLFPARNGRVLIYPQATKYLATQRDPFAGQFELFRRALTSRTEHVLAVCGYSCGDEHINHEIELAMQMPDNKTTLLVFSSSVTPILADWQKRPWGERMYLITGDGLYVGSEGPFAKPLAGKTHNWWKFDGVTDLLCKGAEACVL